jgi:hypothetical protein
MNKSALRAISSELFTQRQVAQQLNTNTTRIWEFFQGRDVLSNDEILILEDLVQTKLAKFVQLAPGSLGWLAGTANEQ